MNRRGFLALCGLGIGTAGGYIGRSRYGSPSTPDGMRVETRHIEKDIFVEDSSRDAAFLGPKEEYQTVLSDRETADREIIDSESTTSFLGETDFEDSYLIVVQNGMQSEMELVLDAISRREHGLRLDVSIDSPRSGPDDLRTHSLLVRVTDRDEAVPEEVSVDIEGYI